MSFEFTTRPIAAAAYEPEGIYLSAPFNGRQRIGQRWGENPGKYRHFRIANVPLQGHNGLDFALSIGTPILATDNGQVIEIGFDREGYGRFIVLQHRWGESLYAHLRGFSVEAGQRLDRNSRIGFAGNTGASAEPHLHFGIRIHPYDRTDGWGGYTDPLPFFEDSALITG